MAEREIQMLAELKRALVCETKEAIDGARQAEQAAVVQALQTQADNNRAAENARINSKPERISRASETNDGGSTDHDRQSN